MTGDPCCGNCVFFVPRDEGEGYDTCHRYPPQVVAIHFSPITRWPQVEETDICGEYALVRPAAMRAGGV